MPSSDTSLATPQIAEHGAVPAGIGPAATSAAGVVAASVELSCGSLPLGPSNRRAPDEQLFDYLVYRSRSGVSERTEHLVWVRDSPPA